MTLEQQIIVYGCDLWVGKIKFNGIQGQSFLNNKSRFSLCRFKKLTNYNENITVRAQQLNYKAIPWYAQGEVHIFMSGD